MKKKTNYTQEMIDKALGLENFEKELSNLCDGFQNLKQKISIKNLRRMKDDELLKALTIEFASLNQKTTIAYLIRDRGYNYSPAEYWKKSDKMTKKQYNYLTALCLNINKGDNAKKLEEIAVKFGFVKKANQ